MEDYQKISTHTCCNHDTEKSDSPCTLWPDTSNRLIDNVVHIDERGIPGLGATEDAHYLPFWQA